MVAQGAYRPQEPEPAQEPPSLVSHRFSWSVHRWSAQGLLQERGPQEPQWWQTAQQEHSYRHSQGQTAEHR